GPRTIIACGEQAPPARERALVARGAEVWRVCTHANGRIDVSALGRQLADAKICSVLVEGGGEVHAYMIERRLADELVLYIAPKVVGGPAKSWVGGPGLESLDAAPRFVFDEVLDLGGDLRVIARPARSRPHPDDDLYHA
ncbi:MAG TPA: RibD family protein, partial [Kofleriaceae bacterium]|nr:RibD family protein [Kofleriaceae bacterium]